MTTWTLILLMFSFGSTPTAVTVIGFTSGNDCAISGERITKMLIDPRIKKIRYTCVEVK